MSLKSGLFEFNACLPTFLVAAIQTNTINSVLSFKLTRFKAGFFYVLVFPIFRIPTYQMNVFLSFMACIFYYSLFSLLLLTLPSQLLHMYMS